MNLLVIGAGGIGSWFIARLSRLQEHDQLHNLSITVADYDEIEEKNLPYQNFELDELMDTKSLALEARYGIVGLNDKIINDEQLDHYDIIVCAVDNPKARKLVFDHCEINKNKYFIDLRSEGTATWGITSDAGWSTERLINSLGDLEADDKSCQLAYELESGIVQTGNIIIAEIGAQWLLNFLRKKKNPKVFSQLF